MTRWTCPKCKRIFGKTNQSHTTCEEAPTLDEYFAVAKPFEKPIFDALMARIGHLEGLIVDPLDPVILLKNGPMFCELRPLNKWVALGFHLGRKVESGRFGRKTVEYGKKYFHVIKVTDPAQIDDELIDWLEEAYHLAGGTLREFNRQRVDVSSPQARNSVRERGASRENDGDGMVPDDVDEEIF